MLKKILASGIASMVGANTTCYMEGGAMKCSQGTAPVENNVSLSEFKGEDLGFHYPMNDNIVGDWI